MKASTIWLSFALACATGVPVLAQSVVTNAAKMTLYTFDKDADGRSACYDKCAATWPPYLATKGEKKPAGWTLLERTDGGSQWAYDGRPTYLYAGDTRPGDKKGEGMGGVWHVLKH